MGALLKSASELAEVVEIDGKQMVRLPEGLHLATRQFRIVECGESIHLNPFRTEWTEEDWERWKADMRRYQVELGDLFPDGREQPPMPADGI